MSTGGRRRGGRELGEGLRGWGGGTYLQKAHMAPLRAVEQILVAIILHLLRCGVGVRVWDLGDAAVAADLHGEPVADAGGHCGGEEDVAKWIIGCQ